MGSDNPKKTKKKQKPKLSTRIKRWYNGDRDEGDAVLLLSEFEEKERRKKPKNPGRRARTKGQEFQKSIEHALAVVYPEAKSASQYLGGKREGSDVQGTPYFIECKDHKTISIPAWWRQAEDDRKELGCEDEVAVVFNLSGTTLACITLEEFVRLQRKATRRTRSNAVHPPGSKLIFDGHEQIGHVNKVGKKYRATRTKRTWDLGEVEYTDTSTPCPNPRKGSDGLWTTLDAAEAEIRRRNR
ncbi:MAG: hypothetical protein KC800_26405 [Candidatus Eremiobacteraeota bacterium]|nr:hypothetical protein [Candidatus Eremiobacteraeota bacterium]